MIIDVTLPCQYIEWSVRARAHLFESPVHDSYLLACELGLSAQVLQCHRAVLGQSRGLYLIVTLVYRAVRRSRHGVHYTITRAPLAPVIRTVLSPVARLAPSRTCAPHRPRPATLPPLFTSGEWRELLLLLSHPHAPGLIRARNVISSPLFTRTYCPVGLCCRSLACFLSF